MRLKDIQEAFGSEPGNSIDSKMTCGCDSIHGVGGGYADNECAGAASGLEAGHGVLDNDKFARSSF